MAILAFQPEEPGVDGRLSVTFGTLCGRSLESIVYMACTTFGFRMGPFQGKDICMIKILHAVLPIMAFQAVWAKLVLMLAHEGSIVLAMAGHTGAYID